MNVISGRISALVVVLLSFVFSLNASEPSPGYLDLNGADRYVKIPQSDDFAIPAGGTMTITFKVTLKATQEADQVFISTFVRNDKNISSSNSDFVGLEVYKSRDYRPISCYRYLSESSLLSLNGNAIFEVEEEKTFHIAIVHDGIGKKIFNYCDGETTPIGVSRDTKSLTIPNYEGVLLGARYVCSSDQDFSATEIERFLNGRIDDVRFYREALTQDEIKADMESAIPLSGKAVIAAYDFADLSEGKVRDISGNGHDGELMGEWPEYVAGSSEVVDERPIVTIEQSEGGEISVYMEDGNGVTDGSRVEANTKLTVVAKPDGGYSIKSVTVNDKEIEFDEEGTGEFTITENSTVAAVFKKKESKPAIEDIPDEDSDVWPGKLVLNGTDRYLRISHDDRFTIQPGASQTICFNVTLKDNNSERQTLLDSRSQIENKSGQEEKGGVEIYVDDRGLHALYQYNRVITSGASGTTAYESVSATSEINLTENGKSHIAAVYDGSGKSVKLYVDGILVGQGEAKDYTVPVFSDILIGRKLNGVEKDTGVNYYYAKGIFDDVHIYSSALTPEQVKMDMNGSVLPSSATLMAAYDFTEFNGTKIPDVSGNNHAAELEGTWPEYVAATAYAINFSSEGEGTLTVTNNGRELKSGEAVKQNETITIKAVADSGSQLKSLTINDESKATDADGELTVTVSESLTIRAVFEVIPIETKMFSVSVSPVEHATITLSTEDGIVNSDVELAEGTIVTVSVVTDEEYDLEGIYVNDVKIEGETITVEGPCVVSVKVVERAASEYSVSYSAEGLGAVKTTVEGVDFESGQSIAYGKTLLIDAVPDEGYMLKEVTVNGTPIQLGLYNTVSIMVDKAMNIVVTFAKLEKRFYTVRIIGNDNAKVELNDELSEIFNGSSIQEGSKVTVKAIPAAGYELIGIYVNNEKLEGEAFILRRDCDIEAKVQPMAPKPMHAVEFKYEGNGALEVRSGDVGVDSGAEIAEGTVLTIKAIPAEGWVLKSVTVNDTSLDIASGSEFEVTVDTQLSIVAVFEQVETPIENYSVKLEPVEHAKVVLTTSDGEIASGAELPQGTVVNLKVTVDEDYELEGIYINGVLLRGETFTISDDTSITVKIKAKPLYTVKFEVRGAGSVSATVDDAPVESGDAVRAGKTLTLNTTSAEGYLLESVIVNGETLKLGPENSIEITVDKMLDIVIVFAEIKKKFYDVKVVWNDKVTVKMRDDVGELSHSNSLQEGSEVTVTAIPAEGYELIGIFVNDVKLTGNKFIVRGNCLVDARVQPIPQVSKHIVGINVVGQGEISVLDGETVVQSGDEVAQGSLLTVKPIPAAGWRLVSLSVNGHPAVVSSVGTVEIELTESITIDALFEEIPEPEQRYLIEIIQPANGIIRLLSDGAEVKSGDKVENGAEVVVEVIPASGYSLESVLVNNRPIAGCRFTVTENSIVSAILTQDGINDDNTTYTVSYSSAGPGHILVTQADEAIESGSKIASGSSIRIRCIADVGAYLVGLRLNGETIATDYLGNAEVTVDGNTGIEAEFAMISYRLVVNTSGHGRAEIYRGIDASGNPVGDKLVDSDNITYGETLHLFAIPENDRILMSTSVNNNGEARELAVDTDFSPGRIERSHYLAINVKGDLVLTLRFSSTSSGVSEIYEDGQTARYYNLQGIEIAADRLTPGVYIRIAGQTRQKILIK